MPSVRMTDEGGGIDEEGVLWKGMREELGAWKKYKQTKAHAFVERGYSVSWYADGDSHIDVFIPERHHAKKPEIRACAKFYGKPSRVGIDGGMVSKLTITRTNLIAMVMGKQLEKQRVLFNDDRGHDVDDLHLSPEARRLFDAAIEELN